jgi:hypothetical protein
VVVNRSPLPLRLSPATLLMLPHTHAGSFAGLLCDRRRPGQPGSLDSAGLTRNSSGKGSNKALWRPSGSWQDLQGTVEDASAYEDGVQHGGGGGRDTSSDSETSVLLPKHITVTVGRHGETARGRPCTRAHANTCSPISAVCGGSMMHVFLYRWLSLPWPASQDVQ